MWWIFQKQQNREDLLKKRIAEGQAVLEEAASKATIAADYITNTLKTRLDDSIRQFDSTARLISDALIICDIYGKIRGFNPVAESMFGTIASKIDKTSVVNLFSLNGVTPSCDDLWHAIETSQDGENGSLQGHRCNNELFPIDISMTRLERGDDASTQFIIILIQDLTNTIASQKLIKIQEQRFQTLFEISFDGILIIQNSTIVAANQSVAKILGIDVERIKNTPFETLLRVNGGDEATSNDGTVQMLYSSTEINWNGQLALLVTIKDISSMQQLSKALQQNLSDGKDMICVFNAELKIKFSNYYFNFYYNLKKATGRDIRDLLPESDRVTYAIKLLELSKDNPTIRSQVQHTLQDGRTRILDWTDHAVFDPKGKVIEYQRTGRDITDTYESLFRRDE